jgi:hypothetical protein
MPEPPTTLEELVEQHRDRDLPTQVYITGSGRHVPEDVEATARGVAGMIAGDDGDVLETDFEQRDPDDVALLEVSQNLRVQTEDVDELRELATVARASAYAGIVGYTNDIDVSKSVLQVIDAVVEVDEDGVEFVGRVRTDYPDGDFYKVELGGIEAGEA